MKLDSETAFKTMIEVARLLHLLLKNNIFANVNLYDGNSSVSFNVCNTTLIKEISDKQHISSHITNYDLPLFPYKEFIYVGTPYTKEGEEFEIMSLISAIAAKERGLRVAGDDDALNYKQEAKE